MLQPLQVHSQDIVFAQSAWESDIGPILRSGILAAFKEVNDRGGIRGRRLRLVVGDDDYNTTKAVISLNTLLAANPDMFALIGGTGTPTTTVLLPQLIANKLCTINPTTGTAAIREVFSPYMINLRPSYRDETDAMLKLIIEVKKYKRLAIVYQDDTFGIPPRDVALAALAKMKIRVVGLHPYRSADIPTLNYTQIAREVLANSPQAIMCWTLIAMLSPLIVAVAAQTTNMPLMVSGSWLNYAVLNLLKQNPSIDPRAYYQTQVVPHPESTTSEFARAYRTAMIASLGSSVVFDYTSLEGYLEGRFAVDTLWRARDLTRAGFLESIFASKMCSINELFLGPFSDTCVETSLTAPTDGVRNSLCNCTQGLHSVSITQLTSSYQLETCASDFTYPLAQCYSASNVVSVPIVLASFFYNDSAANSLAMMKLQTALTAASPSAYISSEAVGRATTMNDTVTRLSTLAQDTLLMGVLAGMPLTHSSSVVTFPIFASPAFPATSFERSTVHFLATLEQQIHVVAKHVTERSPTTQVCLVYSESYQRTYHVDVTSFVFRSLETFGFVLSCTVPFNGPTALDAALAPLAQDASVIVLGLDGDVAAASVMNFLGTHSQANVYLPFSDVGLHWATFTASSAAPSLLSRLLFATNLPNWMTPVNSTFVGSMQASLPVDPHPMAAVGYLLSRALSFVLTRSESGVFGYLDALYASSVVTIDELVFGPFVDTQCERNCLCNIGPRTVHVFRLSAITQYLGAEMSMRFPSCEVEYKAMPKGGLSTTAIALIAVILPLATIVLLGGAIILVRRWMKVFYAPKELTKPFCSLFVSLKKESSLWDHFPHAMGEITELYSKIIRNCAASCHCYEVKHVGGAVLVVSKDCDSMLSCATQMSKELASVNWQKLLAEARAKVAKAANVDGSSCGGDKVSRSGKTNDSSHQTSSKNEASRVSSEHSSTRVEDLMVAFGFGMHFGHGRIIRNSEDNSYDYGGSCVEGAAVISDAACGGQLLVSADLASNAAAQFQSLFVDFTSVSMGKREVKLKQFNPAGQPVTVFSSENNDANVDSIAAALEQQSSGATVKRVVVMHAFDSSLATLPTDTCDVVATAYQERYQHIRSITHREKGYMQSFTAGRLTVTFNAAAPTPQALRRAFIVANDLVGDSSTVSCGIGCGKCVVGSFTSSSAKDKHEAIIGPVPDAAMRLQNLCERYRVSGARVLMSVTSHDATSIVDEVTLFARIEFVDLVKRPECDRVEGIFNIVDFKPACEANEWMYELESGAKNDEYSHSNAIFLNLLAGQDPNGDKLRLLVESSAADSAEKGVGRPAKQQLDSLLSQCKAGKKLEDVVAICR